MSGHLAFVFTAELLMTLDASVRDVMQMRLKRYQAVAAVLIALASAVALAIFAFKGQGDIVGAAWPVVVLGWMLVWLSAMATLAICTPRKLAATPTVINVAGAQQHG